MATNSSTTSATKPVTSANTDAVSGREWGYQEIADHLRRQILSGELPPGRAVPSENDIVRDYDVSRGTAGRAIGILRTEGLVATLRKQGSVVRRRATDPPTYAPVRALRSTGTSPDGHDTGYADVDADAPEWVTVDRSTYVAEANLGQAVALGVAPRTTLAVHERLMERLGRRMLHRLFLPLSTVAATPSLKDDGFVPTEELYGLLCGAGHRLSWTEGVTARMPYPDDIASLRMPAEGVPMLVTQRTTTDRDTGRALALEETWLSSDETQLTYPLAVVEPI